MLKQDTRITVSDGRVPLLIKQNHGRKLVSEIQKMYTGLSLLLYDRIGCQTTSKVEWL